MTKVVVYGYGKDWYKLEEYIRFALETANKSRASAVIFSGGDTTSEVDGPWEEVETEAEIMKLIARESIIFLTGKMMRIFLEEKAYNTLTNMLYSKQLIDDETEEIIIVCNKAHILKVRMAVIKVFGLGSLRQQVSFHSFPLTTGKIENLKILVKTIPEVIGYFFRPLGRRIEYKQWKLRTGRNEQMTYEEFCSKFRNTGELI